MLLIWKKDIQKMCGKLLEDVIGKILHTFFQHWLKVVVRLAQGKRFFCWVSIWSKSRHIWGPKRWRHCGHICKDGKVPGKNKHVDGKSEFPLYRFFSIAPCSQGKWWTSSPQFCSVFLLIQRGYFTLLLCRMTNDVITGDFWEPNQMQWQHEPGPLQAVLNSNKV